jgi:predicted transposase YdaD
MNMLFVEYDPVEARKVAIEEGYEDGFERGQEAGRAAGLEAGRAAGAANARLENARRMKADGVDDALILKYTGLSAVEIEKINL